MKIMITSRDENYVYYMVFDETGAWIGENYLAIHPVMERLRQSGLSMEEVILEMNSLPDVTEPDYSNLFKFFSKTDHTHPIHDHSHKHEDLEQRNVEARKYTREVETELARAKTELVEAQSQITGLSQDIQSRSSILSEAVVNVSNRLHELKERFDGHGPHNLVSVNDLKAALDSVAHRFRAVEDRLAKAEDAIVAQDAFNQQIRGSLQPILTRLNEHDTAIQSIGSAERWAQLGQDQIVDGKVRRIMERLQ